MHAAAAPVYGESGGSGLRAVGVEDDGRAWDEFVTRCDAGTFCHLFAWRAIFTDVLGHACDYRAAVDSDGRWHGVLPLVRMRSRLFGDRLISVPFLNYGGPLGSPRACRTLADWTLQEARRSGAAAAELRARRPLGATPGYRAGRDKVAVVLELPDSADTLWNDRFGSKLRSQIRRPRKEGMHVAFGADQVPAFYDVFRRNMRDLGTPVLPRALFERVANDFRDLAVVGAVYHGADPVAAGFGFAFGGEFEMTWASSLRAFNRLAPNMLLYWSFMERMIECGVRVFNFGRSTPGAGTHRFKRQWGGEDEALAWAEWSKRGDRQAGAADGRVRGAATAVWRRLPHGVADRLGPAVARRLPWW